MQQFAEMNCALLEKKNINPIPRQLTERVIIL
jgi:hypothetical protein